MWKAEFSDSKPDPGVTIKSVQSSAAKTRQEGAAQTAEILTDDREVQAVELVSIAVQTETVDTHPILLDEASQTRAVSVDSRLICALSWRYLIIFVFLVIVFVILMNIR